MTQERRRGGLSEEELEMLAERITSKITDERNECHLTPDQQRAVVDIINMKKKGVKYTLYLAGALLLWILKDVYVFVQAHLAWMRH